MSEQALLDGKRYGRLLSRTLPRVIRTDEECDHMAEELLEFERHSDRLSAEERELAELMTVLIEQYERTHYPMDKLSTAHQLLRQLMEDRGTKQTELAALFGSSGVASEVVRDKRSISKSQAKKLAAFFKVPIDVFID